MKKFFQTLIFLSSISSILVHAEEKTRIPQVQIVDSINAGVQLRLERALATAREWKSPAIFVELDTPGGYLEVTRQIVQRFLASDDVLVVLHVTPQGARAASAGAMITMAAHYAAMSPSTSIGAATPVSGGGKEIEGAMKNKITNDTVAFVEGIAEKRSRNKSFAKESVTLASSLTASDAVKKNVVDGVHSNREEVWQGARTKFKTLPQNVEFVVLDMNLKEQTMSLLSNPNVAMGLMALGMLGIYIEMNSPGLIVPGLVGVTSLALGAFSTQLIPIRTGAIVLLVLGLIFLGIEVLTSLPTFGIAGAASLLMFFLGGMFLIDGQEADLHLDPVLWIPIFLVVTAATVFLTLSALKALNAKNMISHQGSEGMVGLTARVTRLHSDHLSVSVLGEIWNAVPQDASTLHDFKVGDDVKIVSQEGLKVFVTK
jgi:membrane-bound serine protease (ClpP class)